MLRRLTRAVPLLVIAFGAGTGCEREPEETAPADRAELTEEELVRGIGPIDEVELGPIDPQLAAEGEQIFASLCASCHRLDDRYVGPALSGITTRRSPEFIMNMILNPEEMARRHPVIRDMVAQFYLVMPDQNLTEDDARAVLEYLRLMDERR